MTSKQIQFQDVVEVYQPSADNMSHTKTLVTVEDYDKQRKGTLQGGRRRGFRRTPLSQPRMSQRLRARASRMTAPTTTILPVSELAGDQETATNTTSKSRWRARGNRKASMLQSKLGKERFATDRSSASFGTKKAARAIDQKNSRASSLALDVAPKVPKRSSFGEEEEDPLTSDTGYSSADSATNASSSTTHQRSITRTVGSLSNKLARQPARFAKSARRRLRIRAEKRRQALLEEKHPKSEESADKRDSDSFGDDSIEDDIFIQSAIMLMDMHHVCTDEATEISLSPPEKVPQRSIDFLENLEISICESDEDVDAFIPVAVKESESLDTRESNLGPQAGPSPVKKAAQWSPTVADDVATSFYTTISSMSCLLADTWADTDLFGGACVGMTRLADEVAAVPRPGLAT